MKRSLPMALAAALLIAGTIAGIAQDTTRRPANLGAESENFGLTPFAAVPTYALTEAQTVEVRALEDRQLAERRALENRFAAEMKALLARQSEERAALFTTLSGQ